MCKRRYKYGFILRVERTKTGEIEGKYLDYEGDEDELKSQINRLLNEALNESVVQIKKAFDGISIRWVECRGFLGHEIETMKEYELIYVSKDFAN